MPPEELRRRLLAAVEAKLQEAMNGSGLPWLTRARPLTRPNRPLLSRAFVLKKTRRFLVKRKQSTTRKSPEDRRGYAACFGHSNCQRATPKNNLARQQPDKSLLLNVYRPT